MSRPSRLPVISFGWYYVALHAENGRRLLTSQTNLDAFLQILTATLQKQGARLHGGYVGETEVHLALHVGEKSASAFTAALCHDYARFFNRAHQQTGSLFKPHPHVLLIQQPLWLIPLVHLIHQLPDRRALESNDLAVWWSSDAVYRRRARMNGLVTTVILRSVSRGSRSRRTQDDAYARRFGEAPDPNDAHRFLHGSSLDPRILGDDDFISDIWRLAGQRPAPRRKMGARNDVLIQNTLEEAIRRFRTLCEGALRPRQTSAWLRTLTLENVRAMSRKHPLPMIRALCVSHLLGQHLATRLQAARFFGCRPEALSAGRRQRHERSFHQLFNQPHSILFELGGRGLAGPVIRSSPREAVRYETVSRSHEPGEAPLEDRAVPVERGHARVLAAKTSVWRSPVARSATQPDRGLKAVERPMTARYERRRRRRSPRSLALPAPEWTP
jgi:hypothetical protein